LSEILSQKEIDSLLNSVSEEEDQIVMDVSAEDGADQTANVYDFKHPNRVSKDQLRTLHSIHESFAKTLNAYLAVRLRTVVDINLISVDQLQYSEFILSVSDPSCIYVFRVEELNGVAILEISPQLVLFIVDRLFGGKGSTAEDSRTITSIEQTVMKKIMEKALENLSTAWQQVSPLTFILEGFETNPDVVQIAPPGETVITISLEIKIQDTSSLMNICFPYIILEDIISKLNVQHFIAAKRGGSEKEASILSGNLKYIQLPIVSHLGQANLTLEDIMHLQKQDVVITNKKVTDYVEISIGNSRKYLGKPGFKGKKKAVKIIKQVEEEDLIIQ